MSELLRFNRSPWLATPLIALTSLTALWALTNWIALGSWARTTALALVMVALAVMIARLTSRSKITPTLVGLVVAILAIVPLYAKDPEGHGFLFPSPAAITALLDTFSEGIDYASRAPAPASVVDSFGSLLTVGLLVFFLVCEHLAVSWRAVASSGLLLFAPWIPAIVYSYRVSTTALVVGLAAWILAMAVSRKNAPIERGISLTSAVAATTASLLLMGFAVPAALGGEGWGSIPQINTPELFDTPQRLNLQLDLRNSLNGNTDAPVLIYVASGPRPDAFRLFTLTDFDGAGWDYESAEPTNHPADTGLLWPESVPGWNESERVRIDVNVLSLTEDHLPIPTSPRTLEVEGNWTYDADTDSVIGDDETTRNLQYAIVADYSFHTATSLRETDALLAEDPSLDVTDPIYLAIPPAVDLASVRAIAEDLTEGKTTRYDQALAIQGYLRNPSVFTYTTAVDSAPGDAVSAFLESKEGYCLQFATTMVVLLRSIGIPARMGYGFLAGEYDGTTGYVVRGKDAHVWPEVYFPSHGWVRFEPTPSTQTGVPPSWADPFAGSTYLPVPREVLEGGAYPSVPNAGQPTNPNGDPSAVDPSPFLPAWAIRVLGAVLGLGLFALFFRWRRRAVATERALHGPEGAWQRLADRLGDLAWPASATPLEARSHVLLGISRIAGRPPASAGALASLSDAVSDYRYSPQGTPTTQGQLDTWVGEVISEAETVTAETKGRPVRGGARSAHRGD